MPDEKQALILHPSENMAIGGPPTGRIVAEMVAGSLVTAKKCQVGLTAEAPSAECLFQKGEAHYYGWDVPQSYQEAARYYRTASDMGHLDASCNLGCLLTLGLGVAKDATESFRLFENAAKQGHAVGMLNLGHHYEAGIGTTCEPRLTGLLGALGQPINAPVCPYIAHRALEAFKALPIWLNFETFYDMRLRSRFSLPNPERTKKFITFYEVILPRPESPLCILRKVKLFGISSPMPTDQVLVLDSGDGWLTSGDLLPRSVFHLHGDFIADEGGRGAEGIIFNATQHGTQFPDGWNRNIVGEIRNDRIELTSDVNQLSDRVRTERWRILGSLYKRGLGVRQNDAEAEKYPDWA